MVFFLPVKFCVWGFLFSSKHLYPIVSYTVAAAETSIINAAFAFLGFGFPHPINLILFFWRSFVVKPPKWRVRLQKGVLLVSGTSPLLADLNLPYVYTKTDV